MGTYAYRLTLMACLIAVAWVVGGCSVESRTVERRESTYGDESTYGYVEPYSHDEGYSHNEFTHPSVPNTSNLNRP